MDRPCNADSGPGRWGVVYGGQQLRGTRGDSGGCVVNEERLTSHPKVQHNDSWTSGAAGSPAGLGAHPLLQKNEQLPGTRRGRAAQQRTAVLAVNSTAFDNATSQTQPDF